MPSPATNARTLSCMQPADPVIAIACSDLHLSHKPPTARGGEPDWYAAMARPLDELRALAEKHSATILYAGDIFDKWDQPPEMINWAIDHLPKGISVPGQHDMPYHDPSLMHKSAYTTLVLAGVLQDVSSRRLSDGTYVTNYVAIENEDAARSLKAVVAGFEWGAPGCSTFIARNSYSEIALVHRYVWMDGGGHPGAAPEAHVSHVLPEFTGYNLVICGDNHRRGIHTMRIENRTATLVNCGCFMRRKADEIDRVPSVLLIYQSGECRWHDLNCEEDIIASIAEPQAVPERTPDMLIEQFVETLSLITTERCSFRDAVHAYLREHTTTVSPRVAEIILQAIRD